MDIKILQQGKAFVLKLFPDLKKLEKAFKAIGEFHGSFDKSDVARKCPYLTEDQIRAVLDMLTKYQNHDTYDLDQAFAVHMHLHGFMIISHVTYKEISEEILLQLSLKPNTFYGRRP